MFKKLRENLSDAFGAAAGVMRYKLYGQMQGKIDVEIGRAVRENDKAAYDQIHRALAGTVSEVTLFSQVRRHMVAESNLAAIDNILAWELEYGRNNRDSVRDDIARTAIQRDNIIVLVHLVGNHGLTVDSTLERLRQEFDKDIQIRMERPRIAAFLKRNGIDLTAGEPAPPETPGAATSAPEFKPLPWAERKRLMAERDAAAKNNPPIP